MTIATQIGGLALLPALWAGRKAQSAWYRATLGIAVFLVCYSALWFGAAQLAPLTGRVPLPCMVQPESPLVSQSPIYCILNRHYVHPELSRLATGLSRHLDNRFPGTQTMTLDAGFPFLDGFPMFPHLSHKDGHKLDLALFYENGSGAYQPGRTRSSLGYGAYAAPRGSEQDACGGSAPWPGMRLPPQWEWPIQTRGLSLELGRNRAAIEWLVAEGPAYGLKKLFIEPHLARRLEVSSPLIRFQGCRAARHDDHIHIEIGA
ncbi:hypothetical protein [Cucumibacter marinus]|uniref:hypothetical protein n=1 Tax=Cucumibacter marinus TaxID=1121252 RepID=UPI00041BAE52|nr:hypothetical protein [Cucumibacter marinus]